jgi:hypothetical protein
VRLQAGDTLVATVPKSGTTWTQALVSALLRDEPGASYMIEGESAWVDCSLRAVEPLAKLLDTIPGRRCLKSHAPVEALPWSKDLFYVATYRHPLDAHFSMRTHLKRMDEDIELNMRYPQDDPDATFDFFLGRDGAEHGTDNMTLESIVNHLKSFVAVADRSNVLILHYADLKRDPMSQADRLMRFLGLEFETGRLAEIVDGAGFEQMRARAAEAVAQDDGAVFSATPEFFAEGGTAKWEGKLSQAQLGAYDAWISKMLTGPERHWLENGGPYPPSWPSVP